MDAHTTAIENYEEETENKWTNFQGFDMSPLPEKQTETIAFAFNEWMFWIVTQSAQSNLRYEMISSKTMCDRNSWRKN